MAKIKRQTASKVATKAFVASRYAADNKSEDIVQDAAKNLSRGKAKNAATAALRRNLSNPTKAEYKASNDAAIMTDMDMAPLAKNSMYGIPLISLSRLPSP